MSSTDPKQEIHASLAEIARALAHEHRLALLESIAQGRRSVEDLARSSGLTLANASRHLQILRRARLVEAERSGKNMLYSLNGEPEVIALLRALGRVGERNLAEIRQVMADYFTARDALAPITCDKLLPLLDEGSVTLLDVRPVEEFALGHLPGALSIPLGEIEARLRELPQDHEIIAYCRGPYCVLSYEAVARLRAKGYRVRRLEDGFPEWKAAGLAVEGMA